MNKFPLALFLITASFSAVAQDIKPTLKEKQLDSIKEERLDQAALLYPRLRQLNIVHQHGLKGNISAQDQTGPLYDGKFQSARTTIQFNLPLVESKLGSVIANVGAIHQFSSLSEVSSHNPSKSVDDLTQYTPMVSLGLTLARRDSIFNRPFTYSATVSGIFNPSFTRSRITVQGIIMTPLIQNANTTLMGGMVVSIDPSSPIPAFLLLSYSRRFPESKMNFMIDLPARIALRKATSARSSLTVQSELGGSNSFFEYESLALPKKLTFSTLEIKTGLLYEYRFAKKMVFSLSAGALSTATSKVFGESVKSDDYIVKNKFGTVPFAQFGISFLPFWRPFK